MGFIVKNTTIKNPLDLLCPHICTSCGELGATLCKCCKNDILIDHINYCPICKHAAPGGLCKNCYLPPCFMVGWRDEVIFDMIEQYKYQSKRAMGDELAELLDGVLPIIDGPVVVVPLPTIKKHIRERGFDHMYKIAKALAKMRGYKVQRLIKRAKNTVQVGADREVRILQAASAFELHGTIDRGTTYILVDDVWTTGASMKAATKKLQQAGASKIILGVLAVSRG